MREIQDFRILEIPKKQNSNDLVNIFSQDLLSVESTDDSLQKGGHMMLHGVQRLASNISAARDIAVAFSFVLVGACAGLIHPGRQANAWQSVHAVAEKCFLMYLRIPDAHRPK